MASVLKIFFAICVVVSSAQDFEFEHDPDEVMIAQESRHYQTVVKPPVRIVKPTGVTNSHRPQYNLDSLEHLEFLEPTSIRTVVKNYKSSNKLRAREVMVKDAVVRAMERREEVGKFAQILPIIRAMSGSQRLALASLVASQVTTPPGRAPLSLAQVRSMFGAHSNATELMLPILLDLANLIRRANRPGKQQRSVTMHPHPQLLRRSYQEDTDDDFFDIGVQAPTDPPIKARIRRIIPQSKRNTVTEQPDIKDKNDTKDRNDTVAQAHIRETSNIRETNVTNNGNTTQLLASTESSPLTLKTRLVNISRATDNATDLMADSTNQTLAQDLPVAEKLRAYNRYIDRKVPGYTRRNTPPARAPPTAPPPRAAPAPAQRRPAPPRKLPTLSPDAHCELFTNTLCLNSDDYPTEAIVQSIRRNKAAAGALLADFKDPGEGALDGVTAAQEAKYNEHHLVSNRRGDAHSFSAAGEAGFMCASSVKYARPQRARATSGTWKYIVNTGEHTQTLRLEKCLKPKESCTYLTDNFKSKCVQVYNYHRLLTWDQQNGLHMDIFKVPTCCSCHIEGYSVSFPPLGHRIHETSSEHFPGEDLSSEQGNHAFEAVQSTIQRPTITKTPFAHKPDSFSSFGENNQNMIGAPFSKGKFNENEDTIQNQNPMDSYGNTYFPDSFNQASSIRNIRKPLSARNPPTATSDSVTLPSYLEPPTPAASNSFLFVKDPSTKYKNIGSQYSKRGTFRPSRRPLRKKISGGPDDLMSSGSSAVESFTSSNIESGEDLNEYLEDAQILKGQASVVNHPIPSNVRPTIGPKLHAATTEKISPAVNQKDPKSTEDFTSNGKRINYNYHPIIDFFGEDDQERDEFIDREDSESYLAPIESEWKPINHPPARNAQTSNLVGRKKLK